MQSLVGTPAKRSIAFRSLGSLTPDPRNARQHTSKHILQLAKSIESFGFNVPLLIDQASNVIAGHGRLLAVQRLGWQEVPTITLEHLTPDQVKAYRIADNRLTDCSAWDERLLAEQLLELSTADLDFDLTDIGFEMAEIDLRIQGLSDSEEDFAEDLLPAPGPVVSQLGDLWNLGCHRVLCGNALEAESYDVLLAGAKAHLVFTDAPFNTRVQGHVMGNGKIRHDEFVMASGEMSTQEFTKFLTDAVGHMGHRLVEGGLLFLVMDWRGAQALSNAADQHGLKQKNLCIWDKGVGGMGSFYRSQHELIFLYKKGTASHTNNIQLGRFGRNRTNVWKYAGSHSFGRKQGDENLLALHPTAKPVAMVADALLDASERGQAVLDPFVGSGTTVLAAEQTGRIAYAMDLEPKYVDVAVRRWQKKTGLSAVHAVTGETFDSRGESAGREVS